MYVPVTVQTPLVVPMNMLPVQDPPAPGVMLHEVELVASHVLPYMSEAVAVKDTEEPAEVTVLCGEILIL
jgi:hypothetical protein